MTSSRIFVTGIDTDVGKTIASAIICESLKADYWKPVQAGDVDTGDSLTVKKLISNPSTTIHKNSYALTSPMSPHAAAEIDNVVIDINQIKAPDTSAPLVIEGAGGLLVPLNNEHTILDIIKPEYQVIVVSRHYLGSINHSLMTIKLLQQKGFKVSVIFNGEENLATESIIQSMTGVNVIGRIGHLESINKEIISQYAQQFYTELSPLK